MAAFCSIFRSLSVCRVRGLFRLGVSPEINALASIIVGLGSAAVLIANFSLWRQEKRNQPDAH